MKHLAVSSYGASLGVSGSRLVVRDGEEKREIPLSRLRTICLMKNGMSISTDLLQQCGLRGIKVFILGGRGDFVTALHGLHDHGLAKVREAQFHFLQNPDVLNLAAGFISGKLRNQRSLLLYFSKYHKHLGSVQAQALISGVNTLTNVTESLHTMVAHKALTLEKLLGLEGGGAASYWTTLRKSNLLPDDFPGRIGRGAEDPGNMMLNYGYAILSSTIWSCIVNAGLEAYCGFLHQQRPGKPSLVLDLMEEYRPWVVDRVIVTMRGSATLKNGELPELLRRRIASEVLGGLQKSYRYGDKKLKLESIIQRQIYRLSGKLAGDKKYRPYLFKW